MSSLFDDLKEGLEEAIAYEKGIGMTPEIKAKIFENFFTTKPAGQGTGLGMGIIRSLIEDNHNGTMLCDTEPGVGTTITFKIPVKICR